MDNRAFIFESLLKTQEKIPYFKGLKNLSVEIHLNSNLWSFGIGILLDESMLIDEDCDNFAVEINSFDELKTCKMHILDAMGNLYLSREEIPFDTNAIIEFLNLVPEGVVKTAAQLIKQG